MYTDIGIWLLENIVYCGYCGIVQCVVVCRARADTNCQLSLCGQSLQSQRGGRSEYLIILCVLN